MDTSKSTKFSRQAAIHALAIVGLITVVSAGMWVAIYSIRFVPESVGRLGAASVYLSSVLSPTPSLLVMPVATTTNAFAEASSTVPVPATTTPITPTPAKAKWSPAAPVAVVEGVSAPVQYVGEPDLTVTIEAIGYIATSTNSGAADGIVATTAIPANTQIAVKFRVTNIGTNVSGPWTMGISIPSVGSSADQVFSQSSLVPSQPSEYIARFDHITSGANRAIVITIDPDHKLTESNTKNNIATTTVTVLGN